MTSLFWNDFEKHINVLLEVIPMVLAVQMIQCNVDLQDNMFSVKWTRAHA